MSCETKTFNIRNVAVYFGEDRVQKFCITAKADVAGSLNNKFFVIHEPSTQAKHYFWFDVDAGGVDPAVPNATGHAIAISANDDAATVAAATQAVVDALLWISASVSGVNISCEMASEGYAYSARDAIKTADKTGFKFEVSQYGSQQADLGPTEEVTVGLEESFIDVTTPQTGSYVIDQLRSGLAATFSFNLRDTSAAKLQQVLGYSGTVIVSDDAESKTVVGYGSGNLFSSGLDVAAKFLLRPIKNVESAVADEDLAFAKARIRLTELPTNTGELATIGVEVTAFLDNTKSGLGNFFSYGDDSKFLLA
jgi:hypothetical protein